MPVQKNNDKGSKGPLLIRNQKHDRGKYPKKRRLIAYRSPIVENYETVEHHGHRPTTKNSTSD